MQKQYLVIKNWLESWPYEHLFVSWHAENRRFWVVSWKNIQGKFILNKHQNIVTNRELITIRCSRETMIFRRMTTFILYDMMFILFSVAIALNSETFIVRSREKHIDVYICIANVPSGSRTQKERKWLIFKKTFIHGNWEILVRIKYFQKRNSNRSGSKATIKPKEIWTTF